MSSHKDKKITEFDALRIGTLLERRLRLQAQAQILQIQLEALNKDFEETSLEVSKILGRYGITDFEGKIITEPGDNLGILIDKE